MEAKKTGTVGVRSKRSPDTEQKQAVANRLARTLDNSLCTNCIVSHPEELFNCMDGIGSDDPEVLVVYDFSPKTYATGLTDLSEKHSFVRKLLKDQGIAANSVRYTGALRCRTSKESSIHGSMVSLQKQYVKACRPYLVDEIAAMQPKVVLLCGNLALAAVFPRRSGIAKYAGSIFQKEDVTYIVTYDPTLSEKRELVKSHTKKVKLALDNALIETDVDYKVVKTKEELERVEEALGKVRNIAFDFEVDCSLSTSGFVDGDKILCVSFCWGEKKGVCIPLDHEDSPFNGSSLAHKTVKNILTNNVPKIAHNGIYDCYVAYHFYNGLKVKNYKFDTLLAHHLLDPTQGTHSLKYLASLYTNFGGYEEKLQEILEALPLVERRYGKIPIDMLTFYNCIDTDITFRLFNRFSKNLEDRDLEKLFYEVVMPTHETVLDLKIKGVLVSLEVLEKLEVQYEEDINTLFSMIKKLPAVKDMENLNLNSLTQLREILFKRYKLYTQRVKKTKSGEFSTDVHALAVLKAFAKDKGKKEASVFLEACLRYKKLIKIKSTYVDGLKPKIMNGYIFPDYLIFGSASGRLASRNPNFQNQPTEFVKDKLKIKDMFVAPDNYKFVEMDFSQIELRNLANVANEKKLIKAFNNDDDIHKETAKAIFKVDEVTDEQRKLGKTINFSSVYGAGPFKIVDILQESKLLSYQELQKLFPNILPANLTSLNKTLSFDVGRALIDTFYKQWPRVLEWQTEQREKSRKTGCTESPFGRRRVLNYRTDGYTTSGYTASVENQAINHPIQSVSSDCLFLAMNAVNNELNKNWKSFIVGTVHDSILLYVHDDEQEEVLPIIKKLMVETPVEYDPEFFKVKLEVDVKIGKSWGRLE